MISSKQSRPWDRYTIETGCATSIGNVRVKQEDRFVDASPLIAVADGMGGLNRGDIAAQTMVDILSGISFTGSTVQARGEIKKAIERAGVKLAKLGSKKLGGESGTTLVGAVLGRGTAKDCWLVFHVGDSRLYSFDKGVLKALTRDHSVVQDLVDAGILTPGQARIDPRRSIVTRAIGTAVSSQPDFRLVEVTGQVLIACSDGITDELDDEDIEWILKEHEDSSLDEIAHALVDGALEVGGHDNATVVLARAIPVTMEPTREGNRS